MCDLSKFTTLFNSFMEEYPKAVSKMLKSRDRAIVRMKCTIPEISWHNRDPVLSLDIQLSSSEGLYRLATSGTDTVVIIWQLQTLDGGGVKVEPLCELTRHSSAVNVVRFSPDGQALASADDEAVIILWARSQGTVTDALTEESEKNKEQWNMLKILRGHLEDIHDLSWSSCSQFLASASIDNTAIMWDVAKGKNVGILTDHKGFVQGVSWDPKGYYIASLCSDRIMRIFSVNSRKTITRVYKSSLPITLKDGKPDQMTKLFYDDTLKSFCRRLTFSPDGEILVAPSGIIEGENGQIINVTHIFSRHNFSRPSMYLLSGKEHSVAVRFCPVLFQLRKKYDKDKDCQENEVKLFHLSYRMVFAVATQISVLIYDTEQALPCAKISNIHYTGLSDISWSSDGQLLVISSTDGYCSLISFEKGELGIPYKQDLQFTPVDNQVYLQNKDKSKTTFNEIKTSHKSEASEEKQKSKSKENKKADKREERSNALSHENSIPVKHISDINTKVGKRIQLITLARPTEEKHQNKSICDESEKMDIDISLSPVSPSKNLQIAATSPNIPGPSNINKTPRRVSLITLSSPKSKKSLQLDSTR